MRKLSHLWRRLVGEVGAVFYVSVVVVAAFVVVGVRWPDGLREFAQSVLDTTAHNLGWVYLLATTGFVVFAVTLGASRFGSIRLGPPGEPPEFSFTSWLAMIFSGGMGVGLVFWGVAEPMTHFNRPPLGAGEPRTIEAAQSGMRYAFFHWGIHQWANFCVVGLAIAYVRFRHNSRGLISETFRPLLGDRVDGFAGRGIDILAVVSTLFGVATTLGLGALQINSGLARQTGVAYDTTTQFAILGVVATLFTISAMTPLDRGIKLLSNLNLGLAAVLLLSVLVAGPTSFVFGVMTQTLGEYLGRLLEMSLVTSPYSGERWVEQWTMFYWAWGLSWAPFVGSFIARISRGRTIREFVFGVMIVPVALSLLWFSTFGGSAIWMELEGPVGIADAVAEEASSGLFVLLDQLPLGGALGIAAVALVTMFVITSADSATFVLGMFTSSGVLNPTRFVRILWGVLQLLVTGILLLSGGLVALRTISIVAAFPFMLLIVLMAISLFRDLKQELARTEAREHLLLSRVEQFLLDQEEREAVREAEEEVHPTVAESAEELVREAEEREARSDAQDADASDASGDSGDSGDSDDSDDGSVADPPHGEDAGPETR